MHRTRPWITAGVALVGAGMVTAATPVVPAAAPLPTIAVSNIALTATDMIIDLVRHGESEDNANGIIGTVEPGPGLTDNGATEAGVVAGKLDTLWGDDIHGIFASNLLRTQETADPLAGLLGLDVTNLAGLNEVPAGWLEGEEQTTALGIMYLLPVIQWAMGNYLFPVFGSDTNGVTFDEGYDGAIDEIYESGGNINVAFTSGAAMSAWTLMNVKNPDFGLVLKEMAETQGLIPNTGQIVIQGNPTDGWTLLSWNGTEVAETPSLITGLFLDYRDLVTAPQIALWNIWEAIQGGDADDISAAMQTGFNDVLAAFSAFPGAVMETLTGAAGDAAGGSADATGDLVGDMLAALAG